MNLKNHCQMKTKKDKNYSFNHVSERLIERFGLPITRKIFDDLCHRFKTDKSTRILVENKDQEIHQIKYRNSNVTFVYSVNREYITTALKWKQVKK